MIKNKKDLNIHLIKDRIFKSFFIFSELNINRVDC